MNRREEIDAIIAEVKPRLESLREDAMNEIRADQERADANIRRYDEAIQELAASERRLEELRTEREDLIRQVAEANLEDDFAVENEIRMRYRDLRPLLETLQDRRASLEEELHQLAPNGREQRDATIHQLAGVSGTASVIRAELEELRARLTQTLDSMVEPVANVHDNTRATVGQLGRDKQWDESP